jgi:hypothetical protein
MKNGTRLSFAAVAAAAATLELDDEAAAGAGTALPLLGMLVLPVFGTLEPPLAAPTAGASFDDTDSFLAGAGTFDDPLLPLLLLLSAVLAAPFPPPACCFRDLASSCSFCANSRRSAFDRDLTSIFGPLGSLDFGCFPLFEPLLFCPAAALPAFAPTGAGATDADGPLATRGATAAGLTGTSCSLGGGTEEDDAPPELRDSERDRSCDRDKVVSSGELERSDGANPMITSPGLLLARTADALPCAGDIDREPDRSRVGEPYKIEEKKKKKKKKKKKNY